MSLMEVNFRNIYTKTNRADQNTTFLVTLILFHMPMTSTCKYRVSHFITRQNKKPKKLHEPFLHIFKHNCIDLKYFTFLSRVREVEPFKIKPTTFWDL